MTTALPDFEAGYAEINEAKIYYEIAGSGVPLVLVHGFSLDRRMWDDQFAFLATEYRVIRYDVRGFGNSTDVPVQPYSYPDDPMRLMDHIGIEAAHLVGLSMGGAIVVDFAVEHPERVLSLVPVDAPLDGVEWLTNFGTRVGIAARLANQIGMDSALDLWLEDELLAPAMNNSDCAAALEEIIRDYTGWHWTSGAKSMSRDTHTSELLNTIVSPTLVIVGEHDLIDFHAMGDVMAEGIDGAHKVVIPNIGHMSNMEDPVAFNALLHGFLSGIE